MSFSLKSSFASLAVLDGMLGRLVGETGEWADAAEWMASTDEKVVATTTGEVSQLPSEPRQTLISRVPCTDASWVMNIWFR